MRYFASYKTLYFKLLKILNSFLVLLFLFFFPLTIKAESLGQKMSGMILLDVERHGEAWYIYPVDNKRYYLGRPADAFSAMRELGLGITEWDFQKIAQSGMDVEGDIELANSLSGKIVIQVEKNGEAWYIYPEDLKKYYLGRPADAFRVMRELGLGITSENLAQIHKPGYNESLDEYSSYEFRKKISIDGEDFYVDIIEINLSNPDLTIITDAKKPYPVKNNPSFFGADTLANFVIKNNGFAGINGTYFCAYSNCGGANYYFYPVYDTDSDILVNDSELKYWTTGPVMVFDVNNKFYYYKDSREFGGLVNFEKTNNIKLQAAIGNKPRLIEDYKNLLIEWDMDEKQKNEKLYRNAIAYKDNKIFLVIARNSTIPDLANILKEMKVEYALNLDGGYSSALFYNDEYMIGPGRSIPNAIVFSQKK